MYIDMVANNVYRYGSKMTTTNQNKTEKKIPLYGETKDGQTYMLGQYTECELSAIVFASNIYGIENQNPTWAKYDYIYGLSNGQTIDLSQYE